ncbi:MAG: sodium:solute symporter family transporter, partial [Vicinamibacteria bacterium]
SLAESRISLLFNAFFKIPVQFIILLTGALLFVFYQFEKPPPVFNPVALERLEKSSLRESFLDLEREYDLVFEERRAAASTLGEALSLGEGEPEARQEFLEANARFGSVRERIVDLVEKNEGAAFNDTNYIFPTFVLTRLPPGVVGLILVAIFAAAMSTVESELTALSSATVIDFYRRYVREGAPDGHYLIVSRIATFFWGGFATLCALYMGRLGSAIEAVNVIGSYFYGPILGVFLLAIGTRRANGHGAFLGILVGFAAVQLTARFSSVSFLYYNLVGTVVAVVFGYGLSLLFRSKDQSV